MTDRDPSFTFEAFTRCERNHFALAAARAVVSDPGGAYNPLLLHGPPGVGKTHLLHAVRHGLLAAGQRRVSLISGESYVAEYRATRTGGSIGEFRARYADCEALLVDDVHALVRFPGAVREIGRLVRLLHRKKVQVVMTSPCHPKRLGPFLDVFQSLEWAMHVPVAGWLKLAEEIASAAEQLFHLGHAGLLPAPFGKVGANPVSPAQPA